jgi:hypothetical protein
MRADELFQTYFLPLYPDDARADLAGARAIDANPAKNPGVVAHLDDAANVFVGAAKRLFEADLALDFSDASVHRLSAALTPAKRDAWRSSAAAGSPANELFNVVVHGAAYVGACIVRNHGGTWSVRRPLWESFVHLTSRAGEADLAVFHWWLKALSDDEPHTLADRYRTHVEVPRAPVDALPVIATVERALPRLKKPRYDLFYKYLRAHIPELRDVGADFPSPERFDDYKFAWIDFALVGGSRMLVMAGLGDGGLSMFWLTKSGFEKSVFIPCDPFPEPKLDVDGEKLRVLLSVHGKVVVREMLWWGP